MGPGCVSPVVWVWYLTGSERVLGFRGLGFRGLGFRGSGVILYKENGWVWQKITER